MVEKFSVNGMTCSVCVKTVERGVSSLSGVEEVSVSLLTKSMTVTYDQSVTSSSEIIDKVNLLGYEASIFSDDKEISDECQKLKKRFFYSLILLIPLLYFSMGEMLGFPTFIGFVNYFIQALLSLLIIAINFKFYTNGIKAVINRAPNMDTLVFLSSCSAYLFSVVVFVLETLKVVSGVKVFFEASAMVLTLVTLGKWIEEKSKKRTGDEISKLTGLIPKNATIITENGQCKIPLSQVKVGDMLIFKAGEHVSVDGEVKEGVATLNKSALTGESLPVEVEKGENVFSGSTIVFGYIIVQAKTVGKQTLFERIIESVKKAGDSKAPVQRIADKVAGVFVPIVFSLSILALVVWLVVSGDVYSSFNYCISVLVISCPCALGLATPVAVMVVSGKGANLNVLYKDAETVQNINAINCVLLDKTATLTEGKPRVNEFSNFSNLEDDEIKQICSSLEQNSSHPLSDCIVEFCGKPVKKVTDFSYQVGAGIRGKIDGKNYLLGNLTILPKELQESVLGVNKDGHTRLFLADEEKVLGVFFIADKLKPQAYGVVKSLKRQGIKVAMITGDNYQVAQSISSQLGQIEFVSDVLPEDKLSIVDSYKQKGYKVAFVGDGVNDSPALKGAHVGIAVGNGSEIAIDSADVVMLGSKISLLLTALGLGKKAFKIIKGNLFWAFFYNVLSIPIAAGVLSFIGITLTPMISSVCMCLSSLFVVTNALRISNYKEECLGDKKMKVYIEGMMCKHCEKRVKETLLSIEGVDEVQINLKKKLAEIVGNADVEKIRLEIEKAGYKVIDIKD